MKINEKFYPRFKGDEPEWEGDAAWRLDRPARVAESKPSAERADYRLMFPEAWRWIS